MSINSSSFCDMTSSSSNSTNSFYIVCQESAESLIVYAVYTFLSTILFPLYILVLYMGFQQWRQTRRCAPAVATMSHTDFFTSNMMIVEITGVLGSFFYTFGTFTKSEVTTLLGVYFFNVLFPGQTLFHVLTCMERYMAVVHPIAYMQLKEAFRVRVRNISTVFTWLLCFAWVGVIKLYMPDFPTKLFLPFLAMCMFVIFFCCLSVLCVLTRPGPGKVGGNKGQADHSNQRAFHMTMAISAAMLMRAIGLLICFGINDIIKLKDTEACLLMDSAVWLTVPSSLVLPLLFLHKAGKLSCCRKIPKSG